MCVGIKELMSKLDFRQLKRPVGWFLRSLRVFKNIYLFEFA